LPGKRCSRLMATSRGTSLLHMSAKRSGDLTAILSKITVPCRSHALETSPIKRSVKRLRAVGRPFGLPVWPCDQGRRFFNEFSCISVFCVSGQYKLRGALAPRKITFGLAPRRDPERECANE